MLDRSHGYDVSVGYTHGFVREMAPDWLDFCVRYAGQATPRSESAAPFRYLELGCGQGTHLCLLAAANPQGEFVGVDFLPEHVVHAQGLADEAGLANARFSEADFVQLAEDWPDELGVFDYVVLHGVYTWVSPEVRAAVVRCLAHATRDGTLVYSGYNAQPGWLGSLPFQHIAWLLSQTSGKPGATVFEETIALFDRLHDGGTATFQILPGLKARVDSSKHRTPNYLIHEYLHEGWSPLWHSEVARDFATAGLAYAATATMAELVLPGVLPQPLRDAILDQPDGVVRQDLQDFVINQALRRDIFRRGAADAGSPAEPLSEMPVHLLAPPAPGTPLPIKASFGELTLQPPSFAGLVDALRSGPRTIGQLVAGPQRAMQAANVLSMLAYAGVVAVGAAAPFNDTAHRLNAVLARRAAEGIPYAHLAAPVFGSAIPANQGDFELVAHRGQTGDAQRAAQLREWGVLA